MQTNFSPAQLTDPAVATSEKILRTCVHCGFCTATCPTYLVLGDELDSPRGRIYLIKDMLEGGKPASPEVVKHLDRCLSCLSCMTTCPSGVHYMHLIDHARAYIEQTYRRPWHDRLMRKVLASILPYPNRFRLALLGAMAARPFAGLAAKVPVIGSRLGAMLELAPRGLPARSRYEQPQRVAARGERRARVALLTGCAQPVLDPRINEAAIRLMTRHGVEVVMAQGEGCCGALVHHMGREHDAHAFAKRNIEAWTREIEGEGLDAILVTTSGCGTSVKDYGFQFRDDPAWAEKAANVSALARDISEYVLSLDFGTPVRTAPGLSVTYHSACSMQHGQKLTDEPKRLLKQLGFAVRDVPEGHICCGSAGIYNILQPEIAGQLRERKVGNILRTRPDIIAAGNLGCMTQIAKGLTDAGQPVPIAHTIELADWATGGPWPESLAAAGLAEPEPAQASLPAAS